MEYDARMMIKKERERETERNGRSQSMTEYDARMINKKEREREMEEVSQ